VLNDAISSVEFGKVNEEFINQLRSSTAVFAAFKTHRQQNDIAKQLLDDNGKLKPYASFKEDTASITGKYNNVWLRTEYDTAVIRARAAANFKKFEEDVDLFPNLKWLPSTSPNPRDTHRIFYNLVLSYDDSFWQSHYPGDEWNCKCGITNTDDPADTIRPKSAYKPSAGIDENPAFTGNIFTPTHPYVTGQYKGADKAVKNFLGDAFTVLKEYKNGGRVEAYRTVDKKAGDYKDIYSIANEFAKKGVNVKILSRIHYKSHEYETVFGDLSGTKYAGKCPDMQVNKKFYEYESFKRPFKKVKVSRMLSHGAIQSGNIVIDNNKGASTRFLLKIINNRVKIGQEINEVWVYEKGKIRLIYKKQSH